MKFLIVTHAVHTTNDGSFFAYGPYIREMNLWIKDLDEVIIVAPIQNNIKPGAIDLAYNHNNIKFISVPAFDILGKGGLIKTALKMPGIIWKTFKAMRNADHIHVRAPGNMGLVGLLVQTLFPKKKKTVKYAGNWDDYQGEHKSYKLQKSIAKNTSFSKNMSVLIYGDWPNFTKNCVPFFTASYKETDKRPVVKRSMNDEEIRVVFLGTLDERKRPEYAIEAISLLQKMGYSNIILDIVGEGPFELLCREKIIEYGLQHNVALHGNVPPAEVEKFLNRSHFLLFLSRMEGWPKVVAESMWWGCVPVTTAISCVPWMLDYGKRGIIVERNAAAAADSIAAMLGNDNKYLQMQTAAIKWARQYTLDKFEAEIKNFV